MKDFCASAVFCADLFDCVCMCVHMCACVYSMRASAALTPDLLLNLFRGIQPILIKKERDNPL